MGHSEYLAMVMMSVVTEALCVGQIEWALRRETFPTGPGPYHFYFQEDLALTTSISFLLLL